MTYKMSKLKTTVTIVPKGSRKELTFESLVKKAVSEAIARQRALGLPNYYINKNGKVVGRYPNGRFAPLKLDK